MVSKLQAATHFSVACEVNIQCDDNVTLMRACDVNIQCSDRVTLMRACEVNIQCGDRMTLMRACEVNIQCVDRMTLIRAYSVDQIIIVCRFVQMKLRSGTRHLAESVAVFFT